MKLVYKLCVVGILNSALASAAIISVTNTNDSGAGSLREAFTTANPGDTVQISAMGTINLASALPMIQGWSVQGPGTNQLTINGGGTLSGFLVLNGSSTISNLTLSNCISQGGNGGSSTTNGGGGGALGAGAALFVNQGTNVTIQNVAFTQNSSVGGNGGAGSSAGTSGGGGGGGGFGSNGGSGGGGVNEPFVQSGGGGGLYNSNGGSAIGLYQGTAVGGGGGVYSSNGGSITTNQTVLGVQNFFSGGGGVLNSPGGDITTGTAVGNSVGSTGGGGNNNSPGGAIFVADGATLNAASGGGGNNYSQGGDINAGGSSTAAYTCNGGSGGGGNNTSPGGNLYYQSGNVNAGAGGGGNNNSAGGDVLGSTMGSEGTVAGSGGGGNSGAGGGSSTYETPGTGGGGGGGNGGANGANGSAGGTTYGGGGGGGRNANGGSTPSTSEGGGGGGTAGLIASGGGGEAYIGGGGGAGNGNGGNSIILGGGGGTIDNQEHGGNAAIGGGGGGPRSGGNSTVMGGGGGGDATGGSAVIGGGGGSNGAGGDCTGLWGGGGGAGADAQGGSSAFGGGGGGAKIGGAGGFGGGEGGSAQSNPEGGAGSGLGGDVFVRDGGVLNVIDCTFSGESTTTAGTGAGTPASDGKNFYLMNGTTTTFTLSNPSESIPIYIAGGINETGLGGTLVKDGPGTLVIETQGLSSFNGDITINAGVVNAASLINSITQVNPGGTLVGTGYLNTITNDGIVAPGNPTGTLSAGTYTQQAGGTLQNTINAAGGTNLLQVTNNASLNGTLSVIADPGIYLAGQTYTFLTAGGGVTGNFSNATSSIPLAFEVLYFPNFAQIKITKTLFRTDCILKGNTEIIRNYIAENATIGTTLGASIADFSGLTCSQFRKAINEINPIRYSGYDWVNASTLTLIRRNIEQRGQPTPSCEFGWNTICGGTWVSIEGGHVDLSRLDHLPPLKASERIYLIGADRRCFDGQGLVGIAGGFSKADVHWSAVGGRGKINAYHLIPYVNYQYYEWDFDASLIASVYRLKGKRPMHFGSFRHTADQTHNGTSVLMHFGVNYTYPIYSCLLTPLASVDYIFLHRRKFKEHGGSVFNLAVEAHRAQFIEGRLGASVASCIEFCSGRLIPRLQGSVVSLSTISGYYQDARIRGYKPKFQVHSTHKTLLQGAPLAELRYELRNNLTFSALYEGFFSRKWQEHSYSGNISWDF